MPCIGAIARRHLNNQILKAGWPVYSPNTVPQLYPYKQIIEQRYIFLHINNIRIGHIQSKRYSKYLESFIH